jgi:hypothetical protein
MLTFPSDPLFAGLAGFSLAALLRFHASRDLREVTRASAWLGLAALARSDGLLLAPVLLAAAVLFSLRARPGAALVAAVLPFLALVGGYVLLAGVVRGDFATGIPERTYDNFESGQQVVFGGTGEGVNPVIEARGEARRIFGTPEENHVSILEAIRRNPAAYSKRVVAALRGLPEQSLRAYGIRFTPMVLLLALRGAVELVRRKEAGVLALLAAWPVPLLSGVLITLFRPGHLQLPFLAILSLAAIGLMAALSQLSLGRERVVWVGAFGGLIIFGLVAEKLAIYYGAVILGAGGLAAVWLIRRSGSEESRWTGAFLALLVAGVAVHGNYPSPRIPRLGTIPEEQALIYMTQTLPQGSLVAAGSPGVVWAARMSYAGLASADIPLNRGPVGFLEWMRGSGFRAVYVDTTLSSENLKVWGLIADRIGAGLTPGFTAQEGDIQVLLIEDPSGS